MRKRRDRRRTVPRGGISPPHRSGVLAWADLDPVEAACVAWLIRRLEAGAPLSARALARELHVRAETACEFVSGPWRAWCEFWIASGTTPRKGQATDPPSLRDLTEKLGETVGKHLRETPATGCNSLAKRGITRP